MNSRMLRASSIFLPLTRSSIGKSFFTDIPVSLDVAVAAKTTITSSLTYRCGAFGSCTVTSKRSSRGEFA